MKRTKGAKAPKEDVSMLRPPISLGQAGAFQIASALRTGTREVQQVLLEECDVILECKVCRNLFRGLPNLLAHKRVYCKERYFEREAYLKQLAENVREQTETVVVQPRSPPRPKTPDPLASDPEDDPWDNQYPDDAVQDAPKPPSDDTPKPPSDDAPKPPSDDAPKPPSDDATKPPSDDAQAQPAPSTEPAAAANADKGGVWDKIKEGSFVGSSSSYQFYTAAAAVEEIRDENKAQSKLELERIAGTSLAVNQKLSKVKQEAESVCSESDSASVASEAESKSSSRRRGRKRKPSHRELLDVHSEGSAADETLVVEPVEATGPLRMSLRERVSDRGYASPLYEKLSKYADCDVKALTCLKCKTGYSSLKTLHFHMVSLHSEKRTYYPCPYCESTFAQLWSLTRHLMKHHRKSKAQVENMRDILRKRAYTRPVEEIGDVVAPRKATTPEGLKVKAAVAQESGKQGGSRGKKKPEKLELLPGYSRLNILEGPVFRCSECNKAYAKKESLDTHIEAAHSTNDSDRPGASTRQGGKREERPGVKGSPQRSEETLLSEGISKKDLKKMATFVDESKQKCLKCHKRYGSVSNLHRHAVRHLGWRRFKCKLCRFTSYNRSECRSHLRRVHTARVASLSTHELIRLIVELDVDIKPQPASPVPPPPPPTSPLARVEMRPKPAPAASGSAGTSERRPPPGKRQRTDSEGRALPVRPRGRPRKCEAKPVGDNNLQMLRTRSGVYKKPSFEELTGRTRESAGGADNGSEDEAGGEAPVKQEEAMDTGYTQDEEVRVKEEPMDDEEPPVSDVRKETIPNEETSTAPNENGEKSVKQLSVSVKTEPSWTSTSSTSSVRATTSSGSPRPVSVAQSPQSSQSQPLGKTVQSLDKAITSVVSALTHTTTSPKKVVTSPKPSTTVTSPPPTRCRPIILTQRSQIAKTLQSGVPIRPIVVTSSQLQMLMGMTQQSQTVPIATVTKAGGGATPLRLPIIAKAGRPSVVKLQQPAAVSGQKRDGSPALISGNPTSIGEVGSSCSPSAKPSGSNIVVSKTSGEGATKKPSAVSSISSTTTGGVGGVVDFGRQDSPVQVSVCVEGKQDSVFVISDNPLGSSSLQPAAGKKATPSPAAHTLKESPGKDSESGDMPDLAPIPVLALPTAPVAETGEMPKLSMIGAKLPGGPAAVSSAAAALARERERRGAEPADLPEAALHTVMTPDSLGPVDIDMSGDVLAASPAEAAGAMKTPADDEVSKEFADPETRMPQITPMLSKVSRTPALAAEMDSPAPSPPDMGEAIPSVLLPLGPQDPDSLPYSGDGLEEEEGQSSAGSSQSGSIGGDKLGEAPRDLLDLIDTQDQNKGASEPLVCINPT